MTTARLPHDELRDLLWSMENDSISAEGVDRIDELVRGDESLLRHYIEYMRLISDLCFGPSDERLQDVMSQMFDLESDFPPSTIPPIVINPSPALHSSLGSFVFSHVAAAVILGIGLLIGLAWRISLPTSESQEPGITDCASVMVGRITALADCKARQWSVASGQWSEITNHKLEIINHKFSLGDRFVLSSGLMEITYDTGAKVILEGPCTYEIDSDRGGYLAVGKLTARVDKRAEGGGRRADKANHYPLPTTHYPLFAVRTPTATVTDLGTEFGVEVENSGATRSHVFQGSVSIVPSPNGRGVRGEGSIVLSVGESARVERGRNRKVVIIREPGQPHHFVRQISKSTNLQISKSPPLSLAPRPSLRYHLTDLGTLGGDVSRALAVNDAGQVVGEATTVTGTMHAFLYANGKIKDLGTLNGGQSGANSINAFGQVVGGSSVSKNKRHAFLYSDGVMIDLGTLGGSSSCAFAINDAGQIVGISQNAQGIDRAFLYVAGQGMKDLGALGGTKARSSAHGINDLGQVVGNSATRSGPVHAFLYASAEGMRDLGTLDGSSSMAFRINDVGQVVGFFNRNDVRYAFLYDDKTGPMDLGELGPSDSYPININNQGQVVGAVERINNGVRTIRAFLYSDGKAVDLNSLAGPNVGWLLTQAVAINDSGQITGIGRAPDGAERAFLLTPIQGARD